MCNFIYERSVVSSQRLVTSYLLNCGIKISLQTFWEIFWRLSLESSTARIVLAASAV